MISDDELSTCIDASMRVFAKWCPASMSRQDLKQEMWVAALEARRGGADTSEEIKRRIHNHFKRLIRREDKYMGFETPIPGDSFDNFEESR